MFKLGVLGVGDLTARMVRGLLGKTPGVTVFLSPRNQEKSQALARDFSCTVIPDNQAVVDAADILLIGVRPAQLAELAGEITLRPGQRVISVVSGVPVAALQRLFGVERCSRGMLSYAAEINRSAVALYPADSAEGSWLAQLGTLIPLATEEEFELATVNACMNGWFYFLLHDLQHWLVDKGLPADLARTLVLSNVEDCVAYARHHDTEPIQALGRSIATPGTFTARGLDMLGLHHANAAWAAACEVVWDALLMQSSHTNKADD